MSQEVQVQDVIDALSEQRNTALNINANLGALVKALEKKVAEQDAKIAGLLNNQPSSG